MAELTIICLGRQHSYPSNTLLPITLAALAPFWSEDEVLCVGDRPRRSASPSLEEKHVAILLTGHRVSKLIVRHYHLLTLHEGQDQVLSMIQENHWVVAERSLVWKTIRGCVDCWKMSARACWLQIAPLREVQTEAYEPPFPYNVVEYFGPFIVNQERK